MAGTSPAELEAAGRTNARKWKVLIDERDPKHGRYYCDAGQYHGHQDVHIANCYVHGSATVPAVDGVEQSGSSAGS